MLLKNETAFLGVDLMVFVKISLLCQVSVRPDIRVVFFIHTHPPIYSFSSLLE